MLTCAGFSHPHRSQFSPGVGLRFLCDDLGLTIFVVTHDLDTLAIVDRVIVLANGKVIAQGPVKEIMQVDDPWVQSYFESRKILGRVAEHHGT